MCFSAGASFGLSSVLFPAGVYCVKSAIEKRPSFVATAIIPILFGIQQASEGFVWIGLGRGDVYLVTYAGYVFLFFAVGFWPFWVPFCSLFTYPGGKERIVLGILSLLGLLVGLILYVPMILHPEFPVAEVEGHSIHYKIHMLTFWNIPTFFWYISYIAIVSSPLFLSPSRGILFLGVALVLSAALSFIIYWNTFASIWCFFSAALSLYLCFYFRKLSPQHSGV